MNKLTLNTTSQIIILSAVLLIDGCAGITAKNTKPIAEIKSDFPATGLIIDIEGLSTCDSDFNRKTSINPKQPLTILVHGCNGSAGHFKKLSNVLAFQGQQSICFSYNDRDSLAKTAERLAKTVDSLSQQLTSPDITVLGHSQGGLIARKALTANIEHSINSSINLKLVTVSAPLSGVSSSKILWHSLLADSDTRITRCDVLDREW